MANYDTHDDPDYYQKRTKSLLQTDYPLAVLDIDFTLSTPFSIHWHWHEDIEFIYIIKGESHITCEQDLIHAKEGDIIFINQSVRHFIKPANQEGCIFYCVIIHPSFVFGFGPG